MRGSKVRVSKSKYYSFGEGRVSLVATIGGSGSKLPVCFTGHIDTVPLGAAPWRMDPFAADTDSGMLYGRGTSDMKCGVAAFTVAALGMAKHLASTCGVSLVITAGEETGCEGAFHLYRDGVLGRAGALVVAEPTSNYPFVGHKGVLWLRAKTRGVTAHGSMPEKGVNAVYKAAHAASRLEQFRFSNPPHALMGQATLNVGTFHGGLNINSVPDQAEIGVDIRTVPTVDHKQLIRVLAEQLGSEVELETLMDLEAVYTEPRNPWIQSVFEIMTPILGEAPKPRVATYFTDAAALNRAYSNPTHCYRRPRRTADGASDRRVLRTRARGKICGRLRRDHSPLVPYLNGTLQHCSACSACEWGVGPGKLHAAGRHRATNHTASRRRTSRG